MIRGHNQTTVGELFLNKELSTTISFKSCIERWSRWSNSIFLIFIMKWFRKITNITKRNLLHWRKIRKVRRLKQKHSLFRRELTLRSNWAFKIHYMLSYQYQVLELRMALMWLAWRVASTVDNLMMVEVNWWMWNKCRVYPEAKSKGIQWLLASHN